MLSIEHIGRRIFVLFLVRLAILLGSPCFCNAQNEQFDPSDYLEFYDVDISNLRFASLYIQDLEELAKSKIDINKTNQSELSQLRFLNESQIESIIRYIRDNGPLVHKYELQAISGLSIHDIRLLLPFLKPIYKGHLPVNKFSPSWTHDFVITVERPIEKARGYKSNVNGIVPFDGDPWQTTFRYFGRNTQGVRLGLLFQKDSGESWINSHSQTGIDYLSLHLEFKNLNQVVRQLNIGDYHLNIGQGLIHSTLFSAAQSVELNQMVKPNTSLRAYHSISESNFLRGAAAKLQISKTIKLIPFVSYQQRDANIVISDLWGEDSIRISSLQETGLHRTQSELEDQNSLGHLIYGGSIHYNQNSIQIGLNWLRHQFDLTFWPRELPYNHFVFRGSHLTNTSLDYRWNSNKIYAFGEVALSEYSQLAFLNGVIFTPQSNLDFGILTRHISKAYNAIGASAFTENTKPNNERGVYITTAFRPQNKNWLLFAAVDYYYHPWQKFRLSSASDGFDATVRYEKRVKRKYQYYLQLGLKSEDAEFNSQEQFKIIDKRRLSYARLHFKYDRFQTIKFQSRIEFRRSVDPLKYSNGILVFQQLSYQTKEPKLSLHSRFTYFNVDDFDSRIYAFEPNLRYSFSVPFFFNQGFRVFLNTRLKWPNSSLGIRYGWTRYTDNSEGFGSGHEFISGKNRQQIRMQFIYHL